MLLEREYKWGRELRTTFQEIASWRGWRKKAPAENTKEDYSEIWCCFLIKWKPQKFSRFKPPEFIKPRVLLHYRCDLFILLQ